jgi:hypothetical protein
MDRLFERFAAMYGRNWIDMWASLPIADVKQAWAEDLHGYSGDELKRGLEACKGYKFPPSLPEFQELCRPAFDATSAMHTAIREMSNRRAGKPENWPSNRHFWAAASIGNDLISQPPRELAARWREAWEQAAKRADEAIPTVAPSVALPAPGRTHRADVARNALDSLKQKLCGGGKAAA